MPFTVFQLINVFLILCTDHFAYNQEKKFNIWEL